MVKLSELTKTRSGTIEIEVSENDSLIFYWHSPKSLQWTEAQFKARDSDDPVKVFRNVLLDCVDYVEDEDGKHKFTAKIFDQLGFIADILVAAFIEQIEPSFRGIHRRGDSNSGGDS